MGKKQITINTKEENPEPVELIADSIIKISDAFSSIKTSRLEERAVLVLIQDLTKLPMSDIKRVLNAAADLKRHFIKNPPKKS